MSKKLILLLLPLLVFMSGLTAGYDNHVAVRKGRSVSFYHHAAYRVLVPGHLNVNGRNKNQVQKNIRVKAWDDAAGVTILPPAFFSPDPQHCSDLVYCGYQACLLTSHFCSCSLRGPPATA